MESHMDQIDKLINQILLVLETELPPQYRSYADEFESLTKRDLLRASYDVLDTLRRKKDWNPSDKLKGLIDKYKIVF